MPSTYGTVPYTIPTDPLATFPVTSKALAKWIANNAVRGDDARLTDARTPTDHQHALADVTDLQAALDAKVDDTDSRLTDSRAPTDHQHALADVTDLQAALDAKVDDTDSRLTDSRTPTDHQHAVADVDGLTARLAALERDTGWRSIPHTGSRGATHVRRVGHTVTLRLVDFAPPTGSYAVSVLYLPPGFQYSGYGTFMAVHPFWSEPASIYGHYSGANVAWLRSINDTPTRPVKGQFAEYRFTTADIWPTALPGTPA